MEKSKKTFIIREFIIAASVCISVIAASVLIAAIISSVFRIDNEVKLKNSENIILISRHGLSSEAPENTLPSIELAAEKKFRAVEFEIQPTKDGVWVLSRDSTLNRMTDGTGKIANCTYFDLAEYSIDSGSNCKKYENLKIPSLDDVLECCLENSIEPVIEIGKYTESSLKRLTDSITNHGFKESCRVISSDREVLAKIHSLNPDIKLACIVKNLNAKQLDFCLEHPDTGVVFKADIRHIDSKKIKELLISDIELFCSDADSEETVSYYRKAGVRNYITDKFIP